MQTKKFSDYLKNINNDLVKYKIIEDSYKGSTKPLKVFCSVCNKEFTINAKNFKEGQGCPDCAKINRKKSNTIELSNGVKNKLLEDGYEVLEYNGMTKPAKIKHTNCGYEFSVLKFKNFLSNKCCANCKLEKVKKINKNINNYQNKLDSLDIPVEIIPEYFYATNKLSKFKCKECGEYFLSYYINFITNSKSPCCCQTKPRHNVDYYINKLKLMNMNSEYELIEETYINSNTEMDFLHKKCGRIFKKRPVDFFYNKQYCTHCSNENKHSGYTHEEVKSILLELNLELLTDYENSHKALKLRCIDCNKVFYQSLNNLKNNKRKCKCKTNIKSHGEYLIEQYLLDRKIEFNTEKTLDNMKYKSKLRLDFFIESKSLAIEFNGIQHYKPIEFFGGNEEFILTQERDKNKLEYCNKNNIRLIIISYKDITKIEQILDKLI